MQRLQEQNVDYVKRFIEGYVLKQDPICLKIFDSLANVQERPDSADRATSSNTMTSHDLNVISSRDSSEEMQ